MRDQGFTLIEVIITIVMVSIAGLMLVSFMNSGIASSANPLATLNDNYQVVKAIEIINADYRSRLQADPNLSMSRYVSGNLSGTINGLDGITAKGEYIGFSIPDAGRNVSEVPAGGTSMYVKITATRNNSKLVTIIGN
jgi:prepilin-type N-terminal cleavage/methylation domain-containing protein